MAINLKWFGFDVIDFSKAINTQSDALNMNHTSQKRMQFIEQFSTIMRWRHTTLALLGNCSSFVIIIIFTVKQLILQKLTETMFALHITTAKYLHN